MVVEPIEIDGILFWGEKKGFLTEKELNRLVIPPDFILHSLRHFQTLPADCKEKLVSGGVARDAAYIERQLAESGSKWNPAIAALNTPEKVVSFCVQMLNRAIHDGKELVWFGKGNGEQLFFSHLVTPDEKSELLRSLEQIGTQGLINVSSSLWTKIERRTRGDEQILVNVVIAPKPPTTDKVVINLRRHPDGRVRPWSIFPGEITPPFPRPTQPPEEQDCNRRFWAEHALIVEK